MNKSGRGACPRCRIARTVNKKADPPTPIDEKIEFSRANPQGVLFLTWLPKEKRKGYPAMRIYDLDNKLIVEALNKKKITVCLSHILPHGGVIPDNA